MTQQQLENLIDQLVKLPRETEWVEFKNNNFDKMEIGSLISALSNSANIYDKNFGYLLYGIDNNTHEIMGTNFKPKQELVGNEELEHWLNQMLSPKKDFIIYEFKYKNDKNLVLIEIPQAIDSPTCFQKNAYIRINSITRNLIDFPEKAQKIWNNSLHKSFEKEIANRDLSVDQVLSVIDYTSYFKLLNLQVPVSRDEIINKLKEDNIIIKRDDSNFDITNLGAILLANNLDDFELLKRKKTRIILYKGNNKVETIKENEIQKGYASSFEDIINYINDKLPSNEEIGRVFRIDRKMYPEIAIRELIANALIHQDLSISGCGPMVEIFDDRIEISNPGIPLVKTDRFIDNPPKSRNESLASLMRRFKICEERGTGIDKVVLNIEIFQLPAPKFEELDGFTKVTLFRYRELSKMSKEDKIRACYQHCVLKNISGQNMTNTTLRERFGIKNENYPIASKIITMTLTAGLIKKGDRQNEYIPIWA